MTAADVDEDEDEDREERRRRRKKRRAPVEEPTPVISGRLLAAAAIVVVLAVVPMSKLGNLIEPKDPTVPKPNTWKVGGKATVAITLVTADFGKLACASPDVFDGTHCAFKSETDSFPRDPGAPLDDNKANIIQPYRTWLDNQLVLVAGLWAQPVLALRLHREPSAGIDEEKLARFVVQCDVTFIGQLSKGSKLRWNPGQWVDPDMNAVVARPDVCKIIEAEPP
jgi:hypothetical protein